MSEPNVTFSDPEAVLDPSESETAEYLEIDTDNLTPEQSRVLEALGARVEKVRAQEVQTFGDISEIVAQEELETLGRWFDWPELPGSQVLLAHASAMRQKYQRLEAAFRQKKTIPLGTQLSTGAQEHIVRDAYFGTAVKGWRGLRLAGKDLPFSEATYRKMWEVRRFRDFVLEKTTALEEFRAGQQKSAEGN